ncbi:Hypp1279 [Branchiostoma lanceolatum]|uniref:Hypp1279 protein n=1 Tax=Branchiostoma lanceolatum TaxID=7740 RepID=A0A8J9ZH93_BRALA|nr:Hypp1279 [Branchiostoma lanceolatum]
MLVGPVFAVLLCASLCGAETQIFRNAGFESPLGPENWSCSGCTGLQYGDDKVEGDYSMLAQGRRADWAGPSYLLAYGTDVISGQTYDFQIYVKLLAGGSNQHEIKAVLSVTFSDGDKVYQKITSPTFISQDDGWFKLTARATAQAYSKQVTAMRIYVAGPAAGVDVLVDRASLTESSIASLIHKGEILENPSFETALDSWQCSGCTGVHYTADQHTGSAAMLARDRQVMAPPQSSHTDLPSVFRTAVWAGPFQDLYWGSSVRGGQCYLFNTYLKGLGSDTTMHHDTKAALTVYFDDGSTKHLVISQAFISGADGWKKMEGDICMDSYTKAVDRVKLYISGPPAGVNFLTDDVFLHEVSATPYSSWRTEADARIEQLRKRNVKIRVNTPNVDHVEVQVVQTKAHFPFGSKVNVDKRGVPGFPANTKYTDWFFDNFNWGVIGNKMKWKSVEWVEGRPDWSEADPAIDMMESRGVPIRGHCLSWAVDDHVPNWLRNSPSADVQQKLFSRIDNAVSRYRGRVAHWDVNNEMLHGNFFERKTGSRQIRYNMFRSVKENDPNVVPFLNDFQIINSGASTQAYVDQINELLDNGAPVEGVGVQCHFPKRPDPVMIKSRLDKVATAGLPIWVTELDVNEPDVLERAAGLEDSLRVAFSHPAVEGIMLWGFWNETHWKPHASLVDGDNFEINEAGRRWRQLVFNDWRTNLSLTDGTLTPEGKAFDFRGFHGDYDIVIKSHGIPMATKTFQLLPGDDTLVLNINIANDIIVG